MRNLSLKKRFFSKVDVNDLTGCWEWTGCLNEKGYGRLTLDRKNWKAHRASYEAFVGPIPEGLTIDHLCRNRKCVKPEHLEAVPHRVNLMRGDTVTARNASVTHCPRGHEYSPENTKIQRKKSGTQSRICRECANYRGRLRWARKKTDDLEEAA